MKWVSIIIIALLFFSQPLYIGAKEEKPKIAAINDVVNLIVKEVVGDLFDVFSILPPNTDPHSFSLTPDIVSKIQDSVLIVLIDPKNFELENSIITNDMLKDIPYLSVKNYTNYGWEYHSIPGLEINYHGSWLYPKNALAIAKAVANFIYSKYPEYSEDIETNVEDFESRLNVTLTEINNVKKLTGFTNLKALVMVPGVAYIVEAAGVEVGGTVLVEPGAFPSASRLSELEGLLKSGEYKVIVMPLESKGNRVDQLAKQLSGDSNVPIVYVLTFSAGGLSSYESLLKYNAFSILATINNEGSVSSNGGALSPIYCYLALGILTFMVIVEAYVIFLYRKKEMEGIEIGE
ncbi:MAG: metal ABC transporter substrate-binding protein [Candidatus Njordarchaeia archaeon]